MIIAIVGLYVLVGILFLIKTTHRDMSRELYDTKYKLDILVKAHYEPRVKEYAKLKGLRNYDMYSDGFIFNHKLDGTAEKIYYNELDYKLVQLKMDILRNCPCPKTKPKRTK
jgi:hypothetical protein